MKLINILAEKHCYAASYLEELAIISVLNGLNLENYNWKALNFKSEKDDEKHLFVNHVTVVSVSFRSCQPRSFPGFFSPKTWQLFNE